MWRCDLCVSAWLVVSGLSLAACEKRAPRENVVPVQAGAGGGGGSSDSGFVPPDAGAGAPIPCGPEAPAEEEFSKFALLKGVGACATLQACRLEVLAERFETAARAHAADQTEANLKAARYAWHLLMRQVEIAELLQFGPAASAMEPGGRGLRDQIYIWPGASRCRVEEQLVSEAYAGAGFADTPAAGRGLTAAEYLLFGTDPRNACPATRPINSEGHWDALGAEQLAVRKAKYAHAVAVDVLARARTLHEAWRADGGNFARALAEPDDMPYADQQAALNAVAGALLVYMDKQVKDAKLGVPLGLIDGSETSMPGRRESLYADVSTDHLKANLAGLRLIAQGCAADHRGLGLDDWLRAVNEGSLANDLIAAIDAADRALTDLELPLEQALVSDRPQALALHMALKRITDLLKAELTSVLDLEPPMSVEGDND